MDRVNPCAKPEMFVLPGLLIILSISGSLIAASLPAALAVSVGLVLFCLPGAFFTRFADPERSLPPALRLAAGGITGYFLSTCAGIAIRLVLPDAHAAVLIVPGALVLAAAGFTRLRRRGRRIPGDDANRQITGPARRISRPDILFLTFLFLFALAAVLPPLANVGRDYPEGEFYRAYFNVDYLKHVAVTGHLAHSEIPPDNPYLKTEEPLHYYWFFYMFPASFRALDLPGIDTLDILRVVTIWEILIFCLFMYGFCRYLSGYPAPAFLAVFCGVFAFSYEGLFLLHRMVSEGDPILQGIGKYNVDAATRWFIGHPQIDGLFRTLIFTPQHLFGLMLFCLSFLLLIRSLEKPVKPSIRILWFIGLMTGLSFGFSSFIAIIGYIWLTVAGIVIAGGRRDLRSGFHLALALGLSCLVMIGLGILYRRPESMVFSPQTAVIRRLPMFLLYNFGPLILLFPLGLVRSFRTHRLQAWNLSFLLALCMFFILFVQISGFPTDMGIKLGLIVSVVFVFFLAIGLSCESMKTRAGFLVLALLLALPALPTLFLDVFNSSDTTNARYSFLAEREDLAACRWIRDHLPEHVRIQSDPYARYEACSIIPTFAERRTVAGDKMHARIFLSDPAAFEKADQEVGRLFAQTDPGAAAQIMKDLGIDYVFVGRTERAKYPGAAGLFDNFVAPYRRDGVAIYSSVPVATLASIEIVLPETDRAEQPVDIADPAAAPLAIVKIISNDLARPHHFVVAAYSSVPGETPDGGPGETTIRLAPGESTEVSLLLQTSGAGRVSGNGLRVALYHLPDNDDSLDRFDFPVAELYRRYHTDGLPAVSRADPLDGQHSEISSNARPSGEVMVYGSLEVRPAGRYRVEIESTTDRSGSQASVEPILIGVRRSGLRDRPVISAANGASEKSLEFELEAPAELMVDIGCPDGESFKQANLRLHWSARNPCPWPLAIIEFPLTRETP